MSAVRHVQVVRSPPAELHGIEHPEEHGGEGEDALDDHRRDGRPDLPGVLWPRAPEERARPAVEYGQVFPQAEALSVEDMYGLV